MRNKKLVTIISCCILIPVIAVALYVTYDFSLANQESKKYSRVLAVINAELKKGKTPEEIVDYLKNNAASLEIVSISPAYETTVWEWQKQKKTSVAKQCKRFNVSCKVCSITGIMSGSGQMKVIIDEQNRTADGVFAGM